MNATPEPNGQPAPPAPFGLTDEASLEDLDETSEEAALAPQARLPAAAARAAEGAELEGEALLLGGEQASEPEPELAADELGPGAELSKVELENALFALLFASPELLSEKRLRLLLQNPQTERLRGALERLPERLQASGLPLALRHLAGGYRLLSAPEVNEFVLRLSKARKFEKISPATLETLAIVAYRQPVTKAEVEAIRGVQSGPILRALCDRGLVRVSGRADQPGAALQYATTRSFLDQFGLSGLEELPRDGELARD